MGEGENPMTDATTLTVRSGAEVSTNRYDSSGKTPAQIEEDIEETRTELSGALKTLQAKFTPPQLLEQGMNLLREPGTRRLDSNEVLGARTADVSRNGEAAARWRSERRSYSA
jgi:hypothetical protein